MALSWLYSNLKGEGNDGWFEVKEPLVQQPKLQRQFRQVSFGFIPKVNSTTSVVASRG